MLASVLSLALVAAPALALNDIAVAKSSVKAGEEFEVTFENDISDGSESFDAGFEAMRVYLAVPVPGWGTGPTCYLENSTATDTASIKVTIPKSVGASGDGYEIVVMEYNSDPNMDGPSGFQYSNDFSVTGATGVISDFELAGQTLGSADYIPCTAYDCVRTCTSTVYNDLSPDLITSATTGDGDISDADQATLEKAYVKMYTCMYACDGVSYPQEYKDGLDSYMNETYESDDDLSASASATGSMMATGTGSSMATATLHGSNASSTAAGNSSSSASATGAVPTQTDSGAGRLGLSMGAAAIALAGFLAL